MRQPGKRSSSTPKVTWRRPSDCEFKTRVARRSAASSVIRISSSEPPVLSPLRTFLEHGAYTSAGLNSVLPNMFARQFKPRKCFAEHTSSLFDNTYS